MDARNILFFNVYRISKVVLHGIAPLLNCNSRDLGPPLQMKMQSLYFAIWVVETTRRIPKKGRADVVERKWKLLYFWGYTGHSGIIGYILGFYRDAFKRAWKRITPYLLINYGS